MPAESSATTPPLSSSDLEEMERLAQTVLDVRAAFAITFPNGGGIYSAAHDALREVAEDFQDACTPERILALLEAARRGREDTARLYEELALRLIKEGKVEDPRIPTFGAENFRSSRAPASPMAARYLTDAEAAAAVTAYFAATRPGVPADGDETNG